MAKIWQESTQTARKVGSFSEQNKVEPEDALSGSATQLTHSLHQGRRHLGWNSFHRSAGTAWSFSWRARRMGRPKP